MAFELICFLWAGNPLVFAACRVDTREGVDAIVQTLDTFAQECELGCHGSPGSPPEVHLTVVCRKFSSPRHEFMMPRVVARRLERLGAKIVEVADEKAEADDAALLFEMRERVFNAVRAQAPVDVAVLSSDLGYLKHVNQLRRLHRGLRVGWIVGADVPSSVVEDYARIAVAVRQLDPTGAVSTDETLNDRNEAPPPSADQPPTRPAADETWSLDDVINRPICIHYLRGRCRYKDTCRYTHLDREAAENDGKLRDPRARVSSELWLAKAPAPLCWHGLTGDCDESGSCPPWHIDLANPGSLLKHWCRGGPLTAGVLRAMWSRRAKIKRDAAPAWTVHSPPQPVL